jgi:CRP/FNR family transcriptional regulator, cyclic AMP receptor protein
MKKILYILGELSDADVDWILYTGRRERLAAGKVLIREGAPIEAVFIVLTGTLKISVNQLTGHEIARLSSGEVVGEISFLDMRLPTATVSALEETTLLAIPRQLLSRKLSEDTGFASRFYRAIALSLSERLRSTVNLLSNGKVLPSEVPLELTDDLSPTVVEHLPLARRRFDSLLRRLREY